MEPRLEPAEYDSEELCPCCGAGMITGRKYKICVYPGVTHEESCATYHYGGSLCDECKEGT